MNQTRKDTKPPVFVVALDFSPESDEALAVALEAQLRSPGVNLHVVSVDPNLSIPTKFSSHDDVREFTVAEERLALAMQGHVAERLRAFTAATGAPWPERITVHPRFGDPGDEIVDAAAALDADVVFIGTQGRTGVKRFVLGSVAEKVARTAGCAVQVVRPKAHAEARSPVEEIEPPPYPGEETPSLVRRYRYHHVSRNAARQPNYPLVYQEAVPRSSL